MMKKKCLIISPLQAWIFFILVSSSGELRGSVIQECLSCWENLCTQRSMNYGQCEGNNCTDGMISVAQIGNETLSICCARADEYVSSAVTSNEALSPIITPNSTHQQCNSDIYNVFTGEGEFDTIDFKSSNGVEQFFLYNTVQFDCNGCINNVSIYTNLKIQSNATITTVLQIWSRSTIDNQIVLKLKESFVLNFFSEDSTLIGNNLVRNSHEVTGVFCFETGNVFGIKLPSDFNTVLTPKSPSIAQTYARENPQCELLSDVYALNIDDVGGHPMIAVGVTPAPTASSTDLPSPTSTSNTDPNSEGISVAIVPVVAGVVVIIIIITVVTIVGIILKNNKGDTIGTPASLNSNKLFNLLKDKSSQWSDIGRAFGATANDRNCLRQNPALNDNDRLEEVLDNWYQSTKDPTWSKAHEILADSLEFNDVAERVEAFLPRESSTETTTI